MSQLLAASDYKSLRAATRRLVHEAGGPASAEHVTRVNDSQLSEYQVADPNPNRRPQFMPIDVVLDLERDTGVPHVTRELARLSGFDLVPATERPAAGRCDPLAAHCQHSVLMGKATEIAIAMDADRVRTAAELGEYERALAAARDHLNCVLDQVRHEIGRRQDAAAVSIRERGAA